MNTRHLPYLLGGLWLGCGACGSDPAPKSSGSSDAVNSKDNESADEEGADDESADDETTAKPAARDAGTPKKDAGKPAKNDTEPVDETEDEAASDQAPVRAVDAGKRPAVGVDAGHAGHVASDSADAGVRPVAPGDATAAAKTFCGKYQMYCGYGKTNRHADEQACLADFEGNPIQQGCKVMHLDTSIAGTAAACNGMQSAFCFSIHCLHATGITDPTGVTYCK
jgi:hypothetical protein